MAQTEITRIVRLDLKGPLHVGQFIGVEREAALDWVPADTLFGALVSAWAALGRDVPALLAGFAQRNPPFLLTSAFPRAGAVRFYPRPWVRHRPPELLARKRVKRLRWVSEGVFRRLIVGEPLPGEAEEDNFIQGEAEEDNFIQGEAIWLTQTEFKQLPESVFAADETDRVWAYRVAPRVTVDRADDRSNLFHTGRVDFAPECGLWFGLRFLSQDPLWPDHVDAALNYLADAGLGGLRSTGHGAFTWDRDAGAIPEASAASPFTLTLSRYAPQGAVELAETLLDDPHTAYQLVTVGGWCHDDHLHPWRRRSLRLVSEGSLLAWNGRALAGHLVDVTPRGVGAFGPHHRVWRYGYAFPVPVARAAVIVQEDTQ
jgi:CRISPR-associated protein Csm4